MSVVRKHLRIGGMSCVSCRNKIERRLKNTAGIREIKVSYQTGFADIIYDSDIISLKDIQTIIEKLDYKVLPETEKAAPGIGKIVGLPVIIVSLHVLLRQFGILNLLVPSQLAGAKMGYGMLFIIGLITSVHCIAMCGGINLSQCIPHGENDNENCSKPVLFRPACLYNLGRVFSYTATGFLLGLIGMPVGESTGTGFPTLIQGMLKIIAGSFMVIISINMLGIFPWLRRFHPRMSNFLAVKFSRKKAVCSQPLIVGLLNGLMPCGPLQSIQIVALASANPFLGALSMFIFSLGTVPLMLGLGSLVSALGKRFSQTVMNTGAVLVAVLGLAMLSQGGSLSGLLLPDRLLAIIIALSVVGIAASLPFRKNLCRAVSIIAAIVLMLGGGIVYTNLSNIFGLNKADTAAGEMEIIDGVQVVNSTLASGRYPNITVQVEIPVKWVINAPEGSINGCNYKMLIKEYGIEYTFTESENIIEFTPTKPGSLQYTCWMGMICGNIFVTDGNETAPAYNDEAVFEDSGINCCGGY